MRLNLGVLKLGVLGVGHFGRFHALKAARGARTVLVGVSDASPERAAQVGAEAGVPALEPMALIEAADALIVAAPTAFHHDLAAAALRAGKPVLVEKPIAATLAQAEALVALAAERGLPLQVGHLERFSAGMAALGADGGVAARVGRPLYLEAVRQAPFRPRSLDVSCVLDLMIHDLDLALSVMGGALVGVDAVGAAIVSERLDMANARLRFAHGGVATLTASRASLRMERRLRLYGDGGYVQMDFLARTMLTVRRGEGETLEQLPGFGGATASWTEHDSLEAEHAAFAAACLDGAPVLVDGAAGLRALDAALRVEAAAEASRLAALG